MRRLSIRLLTLAVLLAGYECLDWGPAHRAVRSGLAVALTGLGHAVAPLLSEGRSSLLLVDGTLYRVTRGCTYLNLALILAPFVWRFGIRWSRNVLHLGLLFGGILALDVGRLAAAVHAHQAGWSWQLAHDWPNLALRWALVVPAVVLALRCDHAPTPGGSRAPSGSQGSQGAT